MCCENGFIKRNRRGRVIPLLENSAEVIRRIGIERMTNAKLIAGEAKISLGIVRQAFLIRAVAELIIESPLIDGIGIETGRIGQKFSGIGELFAIDQNSGALAECPGAFGVRQFRLLEIIDERYFRIRGIIIAKL